MSTRSPSPEGADLDARLEAAVDQVGANDERARQRDLAADDVIAGGEGAHLELARALVVDGPADAVSVALVASVRPATGR